MPFFTDSTAVGAGFALPYYWVINNDKDKAIEMATEVINSFAEKYKKSWFKMMRKKLGLLRLSLIHI